MNLEFLPAFVNRLEGFVEVIAQDKLSAARKFHKEIVTACKEIQIYFDDENIRDLVHKGFVIIYKIDGDMIRVFAFINRNEFSERTST